MIAVKMAPRPRGLERGPNGGQRFGVQELAKAAGVGLRVAGCLLDGGIQWQPSYFGSGARFRGVDSLSLGVGHADDEGRHELVVWPLAGVPEARGSIELVGCLAGAAHLAEDMRSKSPRFA